MIVANNGSMQSLNNENHKKIIKQVDVCVLIML